MVLPILTNRPLNAPITSMQGAYADPCAICILRDVCVRGCCGSHGGCVQKSCYRTCNTCGGGDIRGEDGSRGTVAVCSKAPLREVYLKAVRKERYEFTKRKVIELPSRSIVVSQGSPGRIDRSPYPDDCPAVAVALRHIWSQRSGWYSQDFRDYLRLPNKKTKLILMTSTHDDILDRAWDAEVHRERFKELGFDYWEGLAFSQYHEMSRFNNLWQGFRSLSAIETSRAHFSTLMPHGLRISDGLPVYRPWYDLAEAAPQLMCNWQYTQLKSADGFRYLVAMLKRQVALLPTKAIWFIGVCTPDTVYNLQLNFPEQRCYFLSVVPWLCAHKGVGLNLRGKLRRSKRPKAELMLENQANFAKLVATAIEAADQRSGVN